MNKDEAISRFKSARDIKDNYILNDNENFLIDIIVEKSDNKNGDITELVRNLLSRCDIQLETINDIITDSSENGDYSMAHTYNSKKGLLITFIENLNEILNK